MFTDRDLAIIEKALVLFRASAVRLAAKEGQPDSVVGAYKGVIGDIHSVMIKVDTMHVGKTDNTVVPGKK